MATSEQLQKQVSDVEKNVAVLQTEFKNYEQIMGRLDEAIRAMTAVSNNLERLLIVHEERIRSTEDDLESHRKEVNERIGVVDEGLKIRIDKLEKSVGDLNTWRWMVVGAWGVLAFIISKVLFGAHGLLG